MQVFCVFVCRNNVVYQHFLLSPHALLVGFDVSIITFVLRSLPLQIDLYKKKNFYLFFQWLEICPKLFRNFIDFQMGKLLRSNC